MPPTPSPHWAPPERLNLALCAAVITALLALQWAASHATSGWGLTACALGFALTGLPLYALMHEAMHHSLLRSQRANDALGFLLSALFPGPFTFLKGCHLGHHKRNRTDAEHFDGFYPHDSVAKKRAFFYSMFLGLFWLTIPLATFILLLFPRLMASRLIQDDPTASAMINGVPLRYLRRIRLEALGAVLAQATLFWALDLHLGPYLALYAAYGLCWSSQNYITHAFSPRDVLNGAFNLRANKLFAFWVLHFNWHLAHHQHPAVPWLYLPHLDDPTRADNPPYWWAFVRFWRGPQPATAPPPASPGRPGRFADRADDLLDPAPPPPDPTP